MCYISKPILTQEMSINVDSPRGEESAGLLEGLKY